MKKFVAILLIFLLSMTGIVAIAEIDFSTYTDAELREVRLQLNREIIRRSKNAETAEAVCLAFAENMQELGHPVEYTHDLGDETGFQNMIDTELNSEGICVVTGGGYEVMLSDDLNRNIAYIRDCMVAMAMAVAQVEGVEIFHGYTSTAMDSCMEDFPASVDSDVLYWYWRNSYGYNWTVIFKEETTLVSVK